MNTSLADSHNQKVEKLLRERLYIQQICKKDFDFRQVCKARAAKDILFFINYFVTTYNPRVKPSLLPLILYPRQEECILWILDKYESGEFATIAKARYTGASWLATCVLAHKLLFEPDFKGAFASNKAESVDKIGSSDALFEKLVMVIQKLPSWMHSIDLDRDRKIRLLSNPSMNSAIAGQSGRDIGRGGRSSMVFVDEYAFVQFDEEALSALSEHTDCCIFISTPRGTNNKFYELCQNPNVDTFYYRWTSDPRRTQEWRDEQTRRFGEQIAAQELDVDFTAAIEGQFIEHKWILACVNSVDKIPGLAEIDDLRQAGLDVSVKGNDKTVLTIRQGVVVEEIQTLPGDYPTQTALKVHALLETSDIDSLCFDADGVGVDIAGALDNLEQLPEYQVISFHGAGKPSDRDIPGLEKLACDVFFNKRAEAWGNLARRIKNTYEHVNGIRQHPLDELISIPDESQLITDLTKPTVKYRGSKLLLESKQDMRSRGLSSPDYADSLAYAFYEGVDMSWLIAA